MDAKDDHRIILSTPPVEIVAEPPSEVGVEAESATCRALRIPELVVEVINYVYLGYLKYRHRAHRDSDIDLDMDMGTNTDNHIWSAKTNIFPCTLVNRLWFHETIRLTWAGYRSWKGRGRSPLWVLERAKPDRQQLYANSIQHLAIEGLINHAKKIPYSLPLFTLKFPSLKILSVDCQCTVLSLKQFLVPTLRSVHVITGFNLPCPQSNPSDEFCSAIGTRCPKLQDLQLDFELQKSHHHVSPIVLAQIIRQLESLSCLRLTRGSRSLLSTEVIQNIAQHGSLRRLEISTTLDKYVQGLIDSQQQLLPNLADLEIKISDLALEKIAPYLTRLKKLNIRATKRSTGALRVLAKARLEMLKCFGFTVHRKDMFPTEDLPAFAWSVPGLEQFLTPINQWVGRGKAKEWAFEQSMSLGDAIIEDMARALPNLLDIRFMVVRPHRRSRRKALTQSSLLSLGQYCPHLKRCQVAAEVDLDSFLHDGEQVTWPNLESLTVHTYEAVYLRSFWERPKEAVFILRAMPKLVQCSLPHESDFGDFYDYSQHFACVLYREARAEGRQFTVEFRDE